MSSTLEKSAELPALMDLRLAFGPGTRLWVLRSREELCYDWLCFKATHANASFREFALRLYAHEKANAREGKGIHEIRKRVAAVFRLYRIRKASRPDREMPAPMQPISRPVLPPTVRTLPLRTRAEAATKSAPTRDVRSSAMRRKNGAC